MLEIHLKSFSESREIEIPENYASACTKNMIYIYINGVEKNNFFFIISRIVFISE